MNYNNLKNYYLLIYYKMELIERIPIVKVEYLKTLSFNEFKPYCKSSVKNEEDRRKQFNIMKHFCDVNIKTRGETTRIYSYTISTPLDVGGRLYCGNSVQGLSSKLRGFLLGDTTTDIDMKNAHPTILKYLCKLHNIKCPMLSDYIENRDKYLIEYGKEYKTEFLKCVNDTNMNKKMKDSFCKDFDKECKRIQKELCAKEEYKHIVDTVPTWKEYNWYGSAINRILCVYENLILQRVISFINSKDINIAVLMFDGLMIYGNYYDDENMLRELENHINNCFPELNMVFKYKSQDTTTIVLPSDFVVIKKTEIVNELSFEKVKEEFEKSHCKIINKSMFMKTLDNDNVPMSKTQIKTSYEHLVYKKEDKNGELRERCFIDEWVMYPKMRTFDDVGVYPNPNHCPSNHYNMWRKFAMEMIETYDHKQTELDFILNHIKILCDNDEVVYNYFIKWIAQMIQFPEVKTNCPTFISKEGAGKGSLMRLFEKMLGTSKVYETTNPSRDVWGTFNEQMASTYLISLNELSKKATLESEGEIKGLITDSQMTINNKGGCKYKIDSYHRFIISTNNEEPINTNKDDRRKFIVRCSDELIGNKQYFSTFYGYLDDINVVKTCYEYFKSIPDMDMFLDLPLPITEHHQNLMGLSENRIEQWLKTLPSKYPDEIEVVWSAEMVISSFNNWKKENDIIYDVDSQKLLIRISRLKVKGISKKLTNSCNKTVFNMDDIKTHYGL